MTNAYDYMSPPKILVWDEKLKRYRTVTRKELEKLIEITVQSIYRK